MQIGVVLAEIGWNGAERNVHNSNNGRTVCIKQQGSKKNVGIELNAGTAQRLLRDVVASG
jgi:hypothetical protein